LKNARPTGNLQYRVSKTHGLANDRFISLEALIVIMLKSNAVIGSSLTDAAPHSWSNIYAGLASIKKPL